jgi:hypothetical protein
MRNSQKFGMEGLAFERFKLRAHIVVYRPTSIVRNPVHRIAEDGTSGESQMDANLMRPPRFQPKRHDGRCTEPFDDLETGNRFTTLHARNRHPAAVAQAPSDRGADNSPIFFEFSLNQRQVAPVEGVFARLLRQTVERGLRLRHHHHARGESVEPMYDAGAKRIGVVS